LPHQEHDPVPRFDSIDRKLLEMLQADDRASLAELSEAVGAAASTINDRIRRLRQKGVISGFHAHVAPDAVGLDLLAFMLVALSGPKAEAAFLRRIKAAPEVLECHHVTGAWNHLLKVRVSTTRDFERFLSETLKSIEGVERTETFIVLSSSKETWKLPLPDRQNE
jgi:Lrp/AsnC family leucine-responsive transcriptional regulator